MNGEKLLAVDVARERLLSAFAPLSAEQISLAEAYGRVLAEDLAARRMQPPFSVSAMDGYAVRAEDIAEVPTELDIVGYAPAGHGFAGRVDPGQAVRIFTGAPVPKGADTIVIQEDTAPLDGRVRVLGPTAPGRNVRAAGLDFNSGEVCLRRGRRLSPRDVGLAAAMNRPWLKVTRAPRVAILQSGDEVVMPGDPIGPHQIVSANGMALAAMVRQAGGIPLHLGIAPDDSDALRRLATEARGADLLLTTGGASVGDHDLVRSALRPAGLEVDFWRVAMRPGKPLLFGRIGDTPLIGLPGNPVSTLVCSLLFVVPAIERMLGADRSVVEYGEARLGQNLGPNDRRQDYLRARLNGDIALPFPRQDSSLIADLARADCLIVRPPNVPAAAMGDRVTILRL